VEKVSIEDKKYCHEVQLDTPVGLCSENLWSCVLSATRVYSFSKLARETEHQVGLV